MKIFTLYLNRIIKCLFCAFVSLTVLLLAQIGADTADLPDAEQIIYSGFMDMSDSIDVYECQLKSDEISSILKRVLKRNYNLFYVDGRFVFTKDERGYVIDIIPSYNMDKIKKAEVESFISEEIRRILFYMPKELDAFGKALYLHDYICTHFEYDASLESNNIYSMLKDKKGTCQGYSYLYSALLSAAGVENDFAYSDEMMHIWNLVKVNGDWYHIDVTWDDTQDTFGYANHKNFLCSDMEIKRLGHTGVMKFENIICDSEKYNDEYLNYVNTAFAYLDGEWYVADNSPQVRGIIKYDFEAQMSKRVLDISDYWKMDDNRFYANCFSSTTSLGGYVYFNCKNKLMRFDGENIVEIYSSQNGEQLCYAVSFGRNICMSFINGDELIKVEITPNGDANGDKSTDICDIIELSLSLKNGTNVKNEFCADVTEDERLTHGDVDALRKILLDLTH